jgi:hypothetical protein
MTLQSGQRIDLQKMREAYQTDCIPVSLLNDFTPIVRLDGGNGQFFVSNDPNCGSAIPASAYPATFQFIFIGGACPGGACSNYVPADGGVTLVSSGGFCDPFAYNRFGCFGATPFCGGGACIGVPFYGWDSWNDYGWGRWRPRWWRPLWPVWRPPGWRPPFWRPPPGGVWPRPPWRCAAAAAARLRAC